MKGPTVREHVIAALLEGRTLIAAEFAREIKAAGATVTHHLQTLGPMVRRVEKFQGKGKHCCEYSAVNVVALREELERNVYARQGSARPRLRFDELLEAWGIARTPAQIELPSYCHRMADNDDENELEAA